jgi:hypothetical protein
MRTGATAALLVVAFGCRSAADECRQSAIAFGLAQGETRAAARRETLQRCAKLFRAPPCAAAVAALAERSPEEWPEAQIQACCAASPEGKRDICKEGYLPLSPGVTREDWKFLHAEMLDGSPRERYDLAELLSSVVLSDPPAWLLDPEARVVVVMAKRDGRLEVNAFTLVARPVGDELRKARGLPELPGAAELAGVVAFAKDTFVGAGRRAWVSVVAEEKGVERDSIDAVVRVLRQAGLPRVYFTGYVQAP